MTDSSQRTSIKRIIFGSNDARCVLETAGGWIDVDFVGASEQTLERFMDYFADHLIAGRPLGQSVDDFVDDLFWGDFDDDVLNDSAERAARDVAHAVPRR
jgi:hypothetical protein